MRIGVFTFHFHPEPYAGATRIMNNVREWQNLGHEIYVFAPSYASIPDCFKNVHLVHVYCPKHHYWKSSWVMPVFLFLSLISILRNFLTRKYKVLVVSVPPHALSITTLLVKFVLRSKIRIVLEVRDVMSRDYPRNWLIFHFLNFIEEKILFRWVDRIVTVTNSAKKYVVDRNILFKKVCVLPNGADLDLFRRSVGASLGCQKINDQLIDRPKNTIVYLGSFAPYDNIEITVKMAEHLRKTNQEFIFLMIGTGPKKKIFEEMVYRSGLTKYFVFTGEVQRERLPQVLQEATLGLVMTSTSFLRDDTRIPTKFYELLSMEIPVILVGGGEPKQIIDRERCGYLLSEDNQVELTQILCDPLRSEKGKRGREFVIRHGDRKKIAQAYARLLVSLSS